jgi:hypothetical protein
MNNRRGQSFIEFCIISGLILVVVLGFGPIVASRAGAIMQSFLNKI